MDSGSVDTVTTVPRAQPLPAPHPIYIFRPHAGAVSSLKYVRIGSNARVGLASGFASGQLSLWDVDTKRMFWSEQCDSALLSVDVVQGDKLVGECRNNRVEVWDTEREVKLNSLEIDRPGFCRMSVLTSDEGSAVHTSLAATCFAVAASEQGKVNVYDVASQSKVCVLSVSEPKTKGMCMCVKGYCSGAGVAHVLGGFEDGSVVDWDCRDTDKESSSVKLFSEPVMCIDYDVSRLMGVSGSPQNTVQIFSHHEGQLCKKFSVELKNHGVADVAIRHDSKIMATGGWDGRIRVFGCKKGKALAILNYHSSTVQCVCFADCPAPASHSSLLACGSKDEKITLWKLY